MKTRQKIWYIDQAYSKIKEGILASTADQSGPYEHPTLLVIGEHRNHKISSNKVFSTEKECKEALEKELKWNIKHMQDEIKMFRLKLRQLSG